MVFKYLVPVLNGPHPTPIQQSFWKGRRKYKKRGETGWIEKWKTTFHLNVESCHKSLFSFFLKYIASYTVSLWWKLGLPIMVICFKAAESESYCQVLPFKKGKITQIHVNVERGVLFPLGLKADTPIWVKLIWVLIEKSSFQQPGSGTNREWTLTWKGSFTIYFYL